MKNMKNYIESIEGSENKRASNIIYDAINFCESMIRHVDKSYAKNSYNEGYKDAMLALKNHVILLKEINCE